MKEITGSTLYQEDTKLLLEETARRALRLFSLYLHRPSVAAHDAERRALDEALEWALEQREGADE